MVAVWAITVMPRSRSTYRGQHSFKERRGLRVLRVLSHSLRIKDLLAYIMPSSQAFRLKSLPAPVSEASRLIFGLYYLTRCRLIMRLATTYLKRVKHLMVVLLRQLLNGPCHLQQSVRQSALAMVDVSNDAKVPLPSMRATRGLPDEAGVKCLKQLFVYLKVTRPQVTLTSS